MKKVFCLFAIIAFCASPLVTFAEYDYSFLDSMTLKELTELQSVLESKIASAKTTAAENDPANTGIWEMDYYVDEFDLPTDQKYIRNKSLISGSFSNSATDGAELSVRILVDDNSLAFVLFEYGRNRVKNSYSSRDADYSITVLDSSGVKHYFSGRILPGGDRIYIDESYIYENLPELLELLKQPGTLRFYIVESDYRSDKYSFTIEDTFGFTNAYNMLSE